MRRNFGVQPWTYPQAVYMIGTYNENGVPNVMNAAWGGLTDSNVMTFCLSTGHKTVENLKRTGAFTVSIGDKDHAVACDYVGLVSGNKEPNKFANAGFIPLKSEFVNAPIIAEFGMCIECKVISFEDNTGEFEGGKTGILKGEIVNISVDESVITDDKIDVKKLNPIIFDPVNYAYWSLGEKVGNAYKDGGEIIKKFKK